MKKFLLPIIILIPLFLNGTGLLAQTGGISPERIQAEMDLTDRLIEQAQDQINATDNPAGMAFLEQAVSSQDIAKAAFAEAQYLKARQFTLLARDLVRRALRTNPTSEQNDDRVLRRLERAGDKLDRAGELLAESDSQNLQAIYDAARENLRRAWDFYNAKQYAPAIKLARQVEMTADRINISIDNQSASTANYERRLEAVRDAISQAWEMLTECNSADARALLEQAEKGLALAEQLAANGRIPAAMQSLQRARELAIRATRECRGPDVMTARYQRLVSQLEQLKEQSPSFTGETKDAVDRLLVQADKQLALAQGFIQSNEFEKAAAALQAAQLALRQAEAYILQTK
jgi:tetratricopeptide (TPR) repeat protein